MNHLNSQNEKTVLVLGATGGFGSTLCPHMLTSGWQVRALTRQAAQTCDASASAVTEHAPSGAQVQNKIQWIQGNLDEPATLRSAAKDVDLIVHAVNVPYPKWDPLMLNYTRTIIDLARDNDAQLMFVGNIYNAGIPADGVISEHTAHAPMNNKGQVRADIENMLEEASKSGVRTTIMRFGDFFGPNIPTANWFDICTKGVLKNKLSMAGPAELPHTYAYLPDAVRAMEQVASKRIESPELPRFMVLPFTGHVFSFSRLRKVIEASTGTRMKIGGIPWRLFKVLGVFNPLMRDLTNMRYLWNNDIQMDGSALERMLGEAPVHTPLAEAVCTTVPGLGHVSAVDREKKLIEKTVYG